MTHARQRVRRIVADVVAMVTFTTIAAALSELFIVGLTPAQILQTRLSAIPLNLAASRPYGIYRDAVMRASGVLDVPGPGGSVRRFVADTFAFTSFKMPLYAVLLGFAGASWSEIGVAIASAIVLTLALGRVFGLYLDFVRRQFGVMAPENPLR